MRFTSLRIDGFKSFADATELPLPGGLVGVIGQNGTGKSNVTEALRWMMGGVSARALRAGDMGAVIFGGSERRGARSWGEVALTIEDAGRQLPAPWTGRTIEVSRKVVRGRPRRGQDAPPAVSTYRVDGDVVTAAEARSIFAAAGTGSGSAALVRQGKIAELIAARAQDRRSLLEEAAGVAGVDVRRREADRRLTAAERDLARQADLAAELEARRETLTEQAEKARAYAVLTDQIEAAKAATRGLDIAEAANAAAAASGKVEAAREAYGRAEAASKAAKANLDGHVQANKAHWRREGASSDRVKKAEGTLRGVKAALAGAERDHARLDAVAAGLERDVGREGTLAVEAEEQEGALIAKLTELDGEGVDGDAADLDGLVAAKQRADAALASARKALEAALTAQAEAAAAARRMAERQREAELDLIDARGRLRAAETRLAALPEGERATPDCIAALEDTATTAAHELSVAQAERAALLRLVGRGADDDETAGMRIEEGYEAALIAALGESNGRTWSALGAAPVDLTALPGSVRPLADYVGGPRELSRRLAAVGVVQTDTDGDALAARLRPGQHLVSRTGRLWSWDGAVTEPGGASAAGTRYANRRRLDEIVGRLPDLKAVADQAKDAVRAAQRRAAEAEAFESVSKAVAEARHALGQTEQGAAELRAVPIGPVNTDDKDKLSVEQARSQVAEAERAAEEAAQGLAAARSERKVRAERTRALSAERDGWRERARVARGREADARAALVEAVRARDEAAAMPRTLAPRREELAAALDAARSDYHAVRQAGEAIRTAMQEAEIARAAAERDKKDAEGDVARVARAAEGAAAALSAAKAEAAEACGTDVPDELIGRWVAMAGDAEGEVPTRADLTRVGRKAEADRTALGPVNHAAADEATDLDARLTAMRERRADVEGAVRTLRRITDELETASRERVTQAYEVVAANFERLFVFLFGGGDARLELVGDDPLEAGLEVMAQPPGKQLTSLSLLSGGEQTLTALALVMAVFQARPAPVCVLDEVDAPLDQRNTERYCRLLEAVSADAPETTFLVVTHHPITTAAMDYLCATSMDEPGVTSLRMDAVPGRREARDAARADRGKAA